MVLFHLVDHVLDLVRVDALPITLIAFLAHGHLFVDDLQDLLADVVFLEDGQEVAECKLNGASCLLLLWHDERAASPGCSIALTLKQLLGGLLLILAEHFDDALGELDVLAEAHT